MWLAAKHPDRVKSLSLHSAWDATDPFLRVVVESWQIMAEGLGSVRDGDTRRGQLPAARASARSEATCPVLPMTTRTSPPEICSSGGGLVRKSWPG